MTPHDWDEDRETPASMVSSPIPAHRAARLGRRTFLAGAGVLAGTACGRWLWQWNERFLRADVAVLRADRYDDRLEAVLRDGLAQLGIGPGWARGKSVLLKPNLVEPRADAPHVNTHPAAVRAAVEVFRRWDAHEVLVAEGQGHVRDSRLVLEASGLGPVLAEAAVPYVDLNHDDLFQRENALGWTGLRRFYFPQTLRRADRVVSVGKMKTHHWAGVTLSMKNLFGVLPGICYGWPKNVLHRAGIGQSILDITATVQPDLAILDGIVGMEGDGPIMGTPKRLGLVVLGTNLPAVDATAARLMGFDPHRIPYLNGASGLLGPIQAAHIRQRAEPLEGLGKRFDLVDHPWMKRFRS